MTYRTETINLSDIIVNINNWRYEPQADEIEEMAKILSNKKILNLIKDIAKKSVYDFKQFYKKEQKLIRILREIKLIDIGDFQISAAFLIRSLLEGYAHSYVDYHLHESKPKVKSVAKDRDKRGDLRGILKNIRIHLSTYYETKVEILKLIDEICDNNNKNSLTSQLNYYIHSSLSIPTKENIIDFWLKIAPVIQTLDLILSQMKSIKS